MSDRGRPPLAQIADELAELPTEYVTERDELVDRLRDLGEVVPAHELEQARVVLSGFEEHFCHLYNRAALGESFEAKEIKAHMTGLLKRTREALASGAVAAGDGVRHE